MDLHLLAMIGPGRAMNEDEIPDGAKRGAAT
jgi:hypothetical protein